MLRSNTTKRYSVTMCGALIALVLFLVGSTPLIAGTWTEKAPNLAPTARSYHAMAYIGNNKVLLFGGYDGGMTAFTDTWLYNAKTNTWTELQPANSPGPRIRAAMAYVGGNKVILYGGSPVINSPRNPYNPAVETWLFDLDTNQWTKLTPTGNPPALAGHGMCFNGGSDKVLLFGGAIPKTGARSNQTWIFDLSDNKWTKSSASGPAARASAALMSMGGDKAILFGGFDGVTQLDDTWRFDRGNNKWVLRKAAVKPPARYNHTGGYVEDGKVVIFGGRAEILPDPNSNSETVVYGDTWIYDNGANTWIEETGVPAPEERGSARMAETNLNNPKPIVLFGGANSEVAAFGDTWTFEAGSLNKGIPMDLVSETPQDFALEQNYPNPFNPTTEICFQMPEASHVMLQVYNSLGQVVNTLVNEYRPAGSYAVTWNGLDSFGNSMPSGFYLYRIDAGNYSNIRKMLLLK